jgi:hypothetical protein
MKFHNLDGCIRFRALHFKTDYEANMLMEYSLENDPNQGLKVKTYR